MLFSDPSRELVTLFLHLEQMEKAGMPLRKSIETAAEDADNRSVKNMLQLIAAELQGGAKLNEAMQHYPQFFDPAVVRLIAAGEKSGKLARVFEICRSHIQHAAEHARKMRGVLRYPKVAGAIILALAIFRNQTAMPGLALVLFCAWAMFWLARKYSLTFKYWTDKLFLILPVIGQVVRADSWAQHAEALALLFEAGIPLREALANAAACVPNAVIREEAENAVPRVVAGDPLYKAFSKSPYADRMMLVMLKAGEDSGNLAHTLREVSNWNDKRTDEALTMLHQSAGPLLTIVLGMVVYSIVK